MNPCVPFSLATSYLPSEFIKRVYSIIIIKFLARRRRYLREGRGPLILDSHALSYSNSSPSVSFDILRRQVGSAAVVVVAPKKVKPCGNTSCLRLL